MKPTDYRMMARDTSSGVAVYLIYPDCVCEPFVLSVFVGDIELREEEFFSVNTDSVIEMFIDALREFKQAGLMGSAVSDVMKETM